MAQTTQVVTVQDLIDDIKVHLGLADAAARRTDRALLALGRQIDAGGAPL